MPNKALTKEKGRGRTLESDPLGDDGAIGTASLERLHKRNLTREYLIFFVQGITMGSVQIVPGVSAGTVAFVMGIYYRWLDSIGTFIRPRFWKMIAKGRWGDAAEMANIRFIVPLFIGIAVGIFTFARGIDWLLENYQTYSWSVFLGTILASCYIVSKRIGRWNLSIVLMVAVGIAGGYFLSGLSVGTTPDSAWFVILSGAAAAGALVLPGISGSYILIVLGKYSQTLDAINNIDIGFLALLALGGGISVTVFAKFLGGLLQRYYAPTVALLLGAMVGSIRALWPWQYSLGEYTLPPNTLEGLTAASLAVIGIVVVLGFELWITRRGDKVRNAA